MSNVVSLFRIANETTARFGAGADRSGDLNEWVSRAGLNWRAESSPVLYRTTDGRLHSSGDVVLYRSDTEAALGVVSKNYKVVQPKEVISFYEDLTGANGLSMETMGAFRGGRTIWALAKSRESTEVVPGDKVGMYVLLATSFDGALATVAKYTTVRVVCMNTLTMALRDGLQSVKVSHKSRWNPQAVKLELGLATDRFGKVSREMKLLAQRKVTAEESVNLLLKAYKQMTAQDVAAGPDSEKKSAEKLISRLSAALSNSPGAKLPSADGTAWGLVNAVTYDIDHARRARNADNRAHSALFGEGEQIKLRAWNEALKLVA